MNQKQKELVAIYIQHQLRCRNINQKILAGEYGCGNSAISGVITGKPIYEHLKGIRKFIAIKLGYSDWQALCKDALERVPEWAN